jgi:uncharacterized membrane protein HdeD (DUF308 family)
VKDKGTKKRSGAFWPLLSGITAMVAGLLGIVTADSFELWAWMLTAVGAMAIVEGLRKRAKGSDDQ